VNEQLLFDKWGQQSGVEWTGTAELAAGQKYGIVMEYYENTGDARAILYWSTPYWQTPYQPKQVIPQGAFSLPVKARSPRPANNAVGVGHAPVLVWSAGEEAVSHNVYFGDNAEAVMNADVGSPQYKGSVDLGAESYDPGPLGWHTAYYWRIDEVEADGTIRKGSLWNFTTADFIVVEDFEAYDDNEAGGTTIFQTWIDGVENGSASYVGHQTAANGTFGETTVIHGGVQAMPLSYFNANSPHYSQTDRVWDSAQNWTVHGVNTLVLYVQGSSLNSAEPLYVAVEDSAGKIATVVQSDTKVITTAAWAEWKIPLGSFTGVDLTRVKALHIGVGSKTSPKPGGSGMIYIDDIRVTAAK
jgi:hypothetical protein